MARLLSMLVAASALARSRRCTVHETPAPALTGPSEFAHVGDHRRRARPGDARRRVAVDDRRDGQRRAGRADPVAAAAPRHAGQRRAAGLRHVVDDARCSRMRTAAPPPSTRRRRRRATGASFGHRPHHGASSRRSAPTQQAADVTRPPTSVSCLPITTTPGAPIAFFTYAPSTGITTATDVAFNASGSYPVTGSRIVNYAWDWGDGTTDNFNASSPRITIGLAPAATR